MNRVSGARLALRTWSAALTICLGLAGFLVVASPAQGTHDADAAQWIVAVSIRGLAVLALLLLARYGSPVRRAALFGAATALVWSVDAAFVKQAVDVPAHSGPLGLLTARSAARRSLPMPTLSFNGLLVIALVAVAVPVLLALVPRLPVPGAVLEVVAGILVGPSVLGEVPLFLLALLVVRAVPALAYARLIGKRRASSAGLMQAATLTFVIVASQIGIASGQVSRTTGAALLAAGLLSAALFPALAVKLLPAEPAEPAQGADESAARVPALLDRRTREFL